MSKTPLQRHSAGGRGFDEQHGIPDPNGPWWPGALVLAIVAALLFAAGGGAVYGIMRLVQVERSRLEKARAEVPLPHSAVMTELFASSPVHEAPVVMLGDSLTEFLPWSEYTGCAGIVNRAVAGSTSADVLYRLPEVLALHPKLAFLMVGVNDARAGASMNDTAKVIAEIVEQLRAAGTEVVLSQVLPTAAAGDMADPTGALNRRIALLNTFLQIRLKPINVGEGFENGAGFLRQELTTDGVHLRAAAYTAWLKKIKPYLNPALCKAY